jgi:hypothetical protein
MRAYPEAIKLFVDDRKVRRQAMGAYEETDEFDLQNGMSDVRSNN